MFTYIIFILLMFVFIEGRTINNVCIIKIDRKKGTMREPSPLILFENVNHLDFLYPTNKQGIIQLQRLEKIYLACPGRGNHFEGIKGFKELKEIQVSCLYQTIFMVTSGIFNLSNLTCKYLPAHVARRTFKGCFNGTITEVGFSLEKQFLTNFEICRNNETYWTYYTKSNISNKIGNMQNGYPRPRNWLSGNFYNAYNMDYLYKKSTQLKTISELVGSDELAAKYINNTSNRYLSRGHMTAKTDFVYGISQRSTFWYMNSAPQWQSINGGNWNTLENNVRKFAEIRTVNLLVYTGIHGQMTLNDVNGNQVPIWLFVNGTQRGLAVPKFYWKIIYDPVAKNGIAFIGLNDPYTLEISDDIFICENIADKIKWLTWKPTNIFKGVSYACSIDDLRKVVQSVPELDVRGILI